MRSNQVKHGCEPSIWQGGSLKITEAERLDSYDINIQYSPSLFGSCVFLCLGMFDKIQDRSFDLFM